MDNKKLIEDIKGRIKNILEEIIMIKIVTFDEEYCNQELLGNFIRLKARDLLRLYFELEKEFKVEIPETEIADGNFNTINNISSIVLNSILFRETSSQIKI